MCGIKYKVHSIYISFPEILKIVFLHYGPYGKIVCSHILMVLQYFFLKNKDLYISLRSQKAYCRIWWAYKLLFLYRDTKEIRYRTFYEHELPEVRFQLWYVFFDLDFFLIILWHRFHTSYKRLRIRSDVYFLSFRKLLNGNKIYDIRIIELTFSIFDKSTNYSKGCEKNGYFPDYSLSPDWVLKKLNKRNFIYILVTFGLRKYKLLVH